MNIGRLFQGVSSWIRHSPELLATRTRQSAQHFQLVPENSLALVNRRRVAIAAIMIGAAMAVPITDSFYLMSVLTMVFFWVTLTQSWNIISGYTGYLSFGHSIFIGAGAFTTGYLVVTMEVSWILALFASGVVGVLIAIVIGYPVLRLSGIYFAIGMLVLNEVFRLLAEDPLKPITNGLRGVIIARGPTRLELYYVMAILAIITVLTMYFVVNTRIGLYLRAIREHNTAAESVGVNTKFWKIFAFCLSAVYISVAGGVYAMYITYINPSVVFNIEFNVQMIFMSVIGGMGTIAGPLFGAIVFGLFKESVTIYALELQQAITGLALVLFVYYQPEGLYGIYENRAETVRRIKARIPFRD